MQFYISFAGPGGFGSILVEQKGPDLDLAHAFSEIANALGFPAVIISCMPLNDAEYNNYKTALERVFLDPKSKFTVHEGGNKGQPKDLGQVSKLKPLEGKDHGNPQAVPLKPPSDQSGGDILYIETQPRKPDPNGA